MTDTNAQENHQEQSAEIESPSSTELYAPLLAPKLRLPHLRSSLVMRERLLELLDAGQERKLTLLSAPAGFGKTTLVSQWVSEQNKRAGTRRDDVPPIAWVALEPADNDLMRFWRYLMAACQMFQSNPLAAQQLVPQPGQTIHRYMETRLTTFVNELASLEHGGILVLEDYHVIHEPEIHDTLRFLIDHLPPTLHIILISRTDPPLPLARWRAHDELYELHAADLRFLEGETSSFLQQTLAYSLAPEVVQRLEAQTEGWPTGLHLITLAARSRRSQQEIEQFLTTFTGRHRHIQEYLMTEVIGAQPEELRQFFLKTTMLPRLTASLCDALTGNDNSDLLLEQLEHNNLFLMPLDESGQWYRYHTLFAEAMQHEARRQLGEAALRDLYARASIWYEQQDMFSEAIEAALGAQQFTRAIELIGNVIRPEHFEQLREYYTLRRWLGQLPEKVLMNFPDFCFMYANMLLFVPDHSLPSWSEPFEKPLAAAEQAWQAEGNRARLGTATALRALLNKLHGHIPQALTLAEKALEDLPEDVFFWRAICLVIKGGAELWAGQLYTTEQTLQVAYALCEKTENWHAARANMLMFADTYQGQGRLHQADETYRKALNSAEKDPIDRGAALLGLAQVAYEWNDLESAKCLAEEALASNQHADEALQVHASLIIIRVLYAQQQTERAQQQLAQLREVFLTSKTPALYREILAEQSRQHLKQGDLAAVQRWLASSRILHSDHAISRPQLEQEALIEARLLIAQEKYEQSRQLLTRWQHEAHEAGRLYHEMEMNMLLALVFYYDKQIARAREIVGEMLLAASIERYQRIFLDEGEALATLLQAVLPDLKGSTELYLYGRKLLQAFTRPQSERSSSPTTGNSSVKEELLEPLSPQELHVLRLLVAGRSNPEIAGELIVSINTVKAHVKSIYHKLDVHNRVEASEIARTLKLL